MGIIKKQKTKKKTKYKLSDFKSRAQVSSLPLLKYSFLLWLYDIFYLIFMTAYDIFSGFFMTFYDKIGLKQWSKN